MRKRPNGQNFPGFLCSDLLTDEDTPCRLTQEDTGHTQPEREGLTETHVRIIRVRLECIGSLRSRQRVARASLQTCTRGEFRSAFVVSRLEAMIDEIESSWIDANYDQ